MLHISDQQVAESLDYKAVADALDQAYADLARGQAAHHFRQRTDCAGVRLSSMGAVWAAQGVAGMKIYPTVAGQFSFALLLFDIRRNRPLAVLDGNELTRLRTAAITALVASKVANPKARKLALFGAGVQGRAQAEALCEHFGFEDVMVVDPVSAGSWCERLAQRHGMCVRSAGAEEAVRGADIVITATRSAQPVFDGRWLRPGCFVSAMGSSSPSGRELDDHTLERAARVLVEWESQALAEAGELVHWKVGRNLEKVVELARLYRSEQGWRTAPQDITVFKTVGVGLSDVAAAHLALNRHVQGCDLSLPFVVGA
jgi:ornithine cyclodeaminase